jgi:hypothetical protein
MPVSFCVTDARKPSEMDQENDICPYDISFDSRAGPADSLDSLESGKLLLKVVLYGSDDQRRAKKLVFMPNSRRKRLKVPIEKEVCIVRSKIRRLYLRFPLGF